MITAQTFKLVMTTAKFPNYIDHWYLWLLLPLHFIPYPLRSLKFIIAANLHKYSTQDYDKYEPKTLFEKLLWFFKKNPQYASDRYFFWYNWGLMGVLFIWGMFRQCIVEENHPPWIKPENIGGGTTNTFYLVSSILLIIVFILLVTAIQYTKKTQEELKINLELTLISMVWLFVAFPFIVCGYFSLGDNNKVSKIVSPILAIVVCILSFLISFGMPVHYASVKAKKSILSVNALDNVDELLKDPEATKLVRDYMVAKCASPTIDFLIELKQYKLINDPDTIEIKYHYLMKKYIDPFSNFHINISDAQVKKIVANTERPSPQSFSEIEKTAHYLMLTDILPSFRFTKEGIQYANKIVNVGQFDQEQL